MLKIKGACIASFLLSRKLQKDCIKNSKDILAEGWYYAVLNHEVLNEVCRTPEHMLWQVIVPLEGDDSFNPALLYAENPITRQKVSCPGEYIVGVLRPELASGIEFGKLKEEYTATQNHQEETELLQSPEEDLEQ